jgi:hypothetical protein
MTPCIFFLRHWMWLAGEVGPIYTHDPLDWRLYASWKQWKGGTHLASMGIEPRLLDCPVAGDADVGVWIALYLLWMEPDCEVLWTWQWSFLSHTISRIDAQCDWCETPEKNPALQSSHNSDSVGDCTAGCRIGELSFILGRSRYSSPFHSL